MGVAAVLIVVTVFFVDRQLRASKQFDECRARVVNSEIRLDERGEEKVWRLVRVWDGPQSGRKGSVFSVVTENWEKDAVVTVYVNREDGSMTSSAPTASAGFLALAAGVAAFFLIGVVSWPTRSKSAVES